MDEVEDSNETLASPELYIIVNGRPTKNKVVWRTLVDVNHIKEAVRKLKRSKLALQGRQGRLCGRSSQ